MVYSVVVVFVVCPARLADGLVIHLLSVLALFLLPQLPRFAGFRLALGHGALLARACVGRLAALLALLAIHRVLLILLAEALLAWVMLVLLLQSMAVLVLLAILIFALLLLIIALVVLLAITLFLTLLVKIILAALLTVLLLLTVLRHLFGKLRLEDQVTS